MGTSHRYDAERAPRRASDRFTDGKPLLLTPLALISLPLSPIPVPRSRPGAQAPRTVHGLARQASRVKSGDVLDLASGFGSALTSGFASAFASRAGSALASRLGLWRCFGRRLGLGIWLHLMLCIRRRLRLSVWLRLGLCCGRRRLRLDIRLRRRLFCVDSLYSCRRIRLGRAKIRYASSFTRSFTRNHASA